MENDVLYKVGIIGLGTVGRRTMGHMVAHDRFTVTRGWDPSATACKSALNVFGDLIIADGPDGVICADDVDVVYIACPPLNHREYVLAALEQGTTIFCEKPLGIDVAESREMVEKVEASGVPAVVNFVFGAAPGGVLMQERLRDGALGDVIGAELRLHFATWPRDWQATATWLEKRDQGGFVREVVSHFVFLMHRLFGPAVIADARVRYPTVDEELAETHVLAQLDCGGMPVTITGMTGGVGPDVIEFTIWGSQRSCRLYDWYKLAVSDGEEWSDLGTRIQNPRMEAYMRQLDNLVAVLENQPHTLPGFREAFVVQELIEELLRR
jgi:predicted dehydrogenase